MIQNNSHFFPYLYSLLLAAGKGSGLEYLTYRNSYNITKKLFYPIYLIGKLAVGLICLPSVIFFCLTMNKIPSLELYILYTIVNNEILKEIILLKRWKILS